MFFLADLKEKVLSNGQGKNKQGKKLNYNNIKIIAFDADDTLWQNESFFREAECGFYTLLSQYGAADKLSKELLRTEVENIPLYGYGIKSFTLSMIETALRLSGNKINAADIGEIIKMGRGILGRPVILIDGAEEVLKKLSSKYKLVLATKGDLLDQERKLLKSGISKYLHHVEIMSDKTPQSYKKLLKYLGVEPQCFMMAGNSLKSDILPVLKIGAKAVYIPHSDTWIYERVSCDNLKNKNFTAVEKIKDILNLV
ncbi:MAG: HAD family hydrolase [Elusimicrobiota bacterium]|nr:HAD family hydrolase [Elusimicrobiota bacterium]